MERQSIHDSAAWRAMISGRPYDALDEGLIKELNRVKHLVSLYNAIDPRDAAALEQGIRGLLGECGEGVKVVQPFRCDYGINIRVGRHFFANFNLTILDEALVTIGDNVFIGPNVSIYTPCHPLSPAERNSGIEWSLPVTIGNDCWIGGSATILPGVTIGDGVTIGAGSVVTRNIPPHQVWAGNPARFIKDAPRP